MNNYYLEQALERVPNKAVLINLVSQRVRQLNAGDRALVKPDGPFMEKIDVALKEVAEGKLSVEIGTGEHDALDIAMEVGQSSNVISLD
jgi:DNA-directed RNA polymerase omega subunit